jgi:regulator of nonsense transcripts 2
VLGRLKAARNLDARQAALVDSAFLACRPPARSLALRRAKERPPVHAFVRHVIFSILTPAAVERCVRLLRRMPWTPDNEAYLLKCALKVHKGRFTAVPAVASLLAGLSRFHESLAVAAVDDVLEAVRDGLEARGCIHARGLLGPDLRACAC